MEKDGTCSSMYGEESLDIPVRDMPLALCDAQSFSSDNLITFSLRYADRTGENYFVNRVYYPEMVKDKGDSHGSIADSSRFSR